MLKTLTLTNFQRHHNLTLEFSPGVNVIAGTSDVGKSAILKGLLWLVTNRPQGLDFRTWGCNKADVVEVAAAIDDAIVRRRRSDAINEYWLDKQRYVAMKGEVPTDIAAFLRLAPVNIQTQFQPHYLLTSSSADVARTLNDACDLSVIDRVVKAVNTTASKAKADGQAASAAVERLTEQIRSLAWVDEAESTLAKAEAEASRIHEKETAIAELSGLLERLHERAVAYERAHQALHALDGAIEAGELIEAYTSDEREMQELQALLADLRGLDAKLEAAHPLDENALAKAEAAVEQYQAADKQGDALGKIVADLGLAEDSAFAARHKWEEWTEKLREAWATTAVCPLCGQEVHHGE